jgi:hypothetical protein
MAGASAKKTARIAKVQSKNYLIALIGLNVINWILNLWVGGFALVLQSLLLSFVSFLTYRMIKAALELGVGYDLWQDLFIINSVVQIGTAVWSQYVWILYLAVPGYGVYKFGGQLLSWIFTPRESDQKPKPKKKLDRR